MEMGYEPICWRRLSVPDLNSCTCFRTFRIRAGPHSPNRRHTLVLLAEKYGIPIIEDDPYGQLRYEGEHLPPLVVLDRENVPRDRGYTLGNVIYLSTFSKILAPGLRLGWIVAPAEIIAKLVELKQGTDLHTSTFTQIVAYEIARGNFLDEHVKKIRRVYRERRDVMLESLAQYFPPEVTWTRPKGGLFIWVTLPVGIDANKLLHEALRQNVAFVPGDPFFAPGCESREDKRHFRMNFSHARPEEIRKGVHRLSLAIKTELRQVPPANLR